MTKRNKISLGLITVGLLLVATMFAYYHFQWGVKPCKGLTTDPANCGDADFGGIYFLLGGLPFVLAGIVGLISSLFVKQRK
jgi:hypothetical protein